MNFLAKNGIKVHVWGNGWTNKMRNESHSNLIINSYPITGEAYARAITSASINLCFLRKLNRDTHTSRTFEIPACRGFMLAERTEEHLNFFSERLRLCISAQEELLERVRYYLDNRAIRDKIAEGLHKSAPQWIFLMIESGKCLMLFIPIGMRKSNSSISSHRSV